MERVNEGYQGVEKEGEEEEGPTTICTLALVVRRERRMFGRRTACMAELTGASALKTRIPTARAFACA